MEREVKGTVVICTLLLLVLVGVSAVWADQGCDCQSHGKERGRPGLMGMGPERGDGERHGPGFGGIGRALGLSETQQDKVEELVWTERDISAPLWHKLAQQKKQLRQAELAAKFDEAAVRAIAAQQAQVLGELTVLRSRTQHQILSLLTPEQRARAARFPAPGEMHGPGGFPPPMPNFGPGPEPD